MQKTESENILKIHCTFFEKEIFPWHQPDLYTPFWRFYWNPVPGGILTVNGKKIIMSPDFFYIIPGYLVFSTSTPTPFSQFYIHFNFNGPSPQLKEILQLQAEEYTLKIIKNFIDGCGTGNKTVTQLTALAVLTTTLLRFPGELLLPPPVIDPGIAKLLKEIDKGESKPLSNQEMAQKLKMSKNGFIRLFEKTTGVPPQQYCQKKRIERACELLHYSKFSIEEIAGKTGFSNRYHFSRVFLKTMKMTPAAFRKLL